MKMKDTEIGYLYNLKIDHSSWDDTLCRLVSVDAKTCLFETFTGITLKKGSYPIGYNSYIATDSDFEIIGKYEDHPEYFLWK